MSNSLLIASGVHKSYRMGQAEIQVLRGVSLSVARGEFVAVMGASGSGKSTLLHLLGALDVPDRGTITFEGRNLFAGRPAERDHHRNIHFGFVFQFYHLLPELNTLENVILPAMVRYSVPGWLKHRRRVRERGRELLRWMGLEHRLRHRPNELSGGERQRVAIARALVNEPPVLLADEPTGNLDARTGAGILELLQTLNARGQTVVMVTHDPNVASVAHRVVVLEDGRIRPRGSAASAEARTSKDSVS